MNPLGQYKGRLSGLGIILRLRLPLLICVWRVAFLRSLSPITATAGMQRNFTVFPIIPDSFSISFVRISGTFIPANFIETLLWGVKSFRPCPWSPRIRSAAPELNRHVLLIEICKAKFKKKLTRAEDVCRWLCIVLIYNLRKIRRGHGNRSLSSTP